MALFVIEKVTIHLKYIDFANIFSKKLAKVFLEQIGINKYIIKLENSKQLFYRPIYRLKPVELEILKTYIKTYLNNSFIQLSKSLIFAQILFIQKINNDLHLCIDYQELNNFTIKN